MFSTTRYDSVPNVSVQVHAERNQYSDSEIMEIKLDPSQLPFCDFKQSYLEFDIQVNASHPVSFERVSGAQSLIKNLTIKNNQGVVLEEIRNYNVLQSLLENYRQNGSVKSSRSHTAALQLQPNRSVFQTKSITNTTLASDITTAKVNHVVKCCLTINSGILNGNKIVPVASMRGLTLQIELEKGSVCFETAFLRSDSRMKNVAVSRSANSFLVKAQSGAEHGSGGAANTPIPYLKPQHDNDTHSFYHWCPVVKSGGDGTRTSKSGAGWSANQALAAYVANSPYNVGDTIQIYGVISETGQPDIDVNETRTITKFGIVSDTEWGGAPNRYELVIYYSGAAINIPIGAAGGNAKTFTGGIAEEPASYSVSYTIMNPVFNLKKVLPPMEYANELDAMEKNNELEFEITTYTDYQNNLPATTHSVQQIIATNTRALSLISIDQQIVQDDPDNDHQLTKGATLLQPYKGSLTSYQFMIDQVLTPNREVSCGAAQPQKALNELNKALVNVGEKVNSLGKINNNWAICRAFTNYNGTYNLFGTNLQLTKKYSSAPQNVITHNFVGHLRSIVMGTNGVQVVI